MKVRIYEADMFRIRLDTEVYQDDEDLVELSDDVINEYNELQKKISDFNNKIGAIAKEQGVVDISYYNCVELK